MSTVSISQRLRPLRFAFLVRPDSAKQCLLAFQTSTCLWGGQFNPVIPFFKRLPDWWDRDHCSIELPRQILNGYLDFFEPDFIIEPQKGMAGNLGFQSNRVLGPLQILNRDGERETDCFGQSVNDLYRHLYKKEFQFARRHKRSVVDIKPEDKSFEAFVACVFGAFPKEKKLEYFGQNFRHVFEPEAVTLNAASLEKIYKEGPVSPLGISQAMLDVDFNDHSDPSLFIMDASQPRDLVDFWNLRIVQRHIVAIPVQWIAELSAFCKKFILKNYRPLPGNPHGVMIRPTVMFSRSFSNQQIDQIYKQHLQVQEGGANCRQDWYPALWRPTPEFMVRTTRPTISASKKGVDSQIDLEKPTISFDSLWPEFTTNLGSRIRFANVVRLRGWGDNDHVATTFPCDHRWPLMPNFRTGREHLISTSEGLIFFPEFKDIPERWELASGTKAISAWLGENKIAASLSDAGRATEQIILTLGGFWGVQKIASAGVVKLLNEMSRTPLTRSMRYQEFKDKIKHAVGKDIWRRREFETLVERNAVELGLQLKCSKCGKWGWYSLRQLDHSLTCELCLKQFKFPITNPGLSDLCRWAYRVIGPFALPGYANGGYAAALAIRFFSNVITGGGDRVGVTWSAGQDLILPGNKKLESDFILWYQRKQLFGTDYPTEIIFGEAKSFDRDVFDDDDMRKAKLLAELYPGAILVFATMRDISEFSKKELRRIKKLAVWGRKYDREHHRPRASVVVLTGTELFAPYSLAASWKERGGRNQKLIAHPSVQVDDLRVLSDLTQQLYLDLPSYGAWLEAKFMRRVRRTSAGSTAA
jgi:hypothetical protein